MKLSIEEIEPILSQKLAPETVTEITRELQAVAEELKQEKQDNKEPKAKNQFCIISLNGETAYVLQMPEAEDQATLLQKISTAARDFNETKKGKKQPVLSMSDAIESLKRKFTKSNGFHIKTKEPIFIIKSDNKLV